MPLDTSYETETMKHHDKLIEDLHLKKTKQTKTMRIYANWKHISKIAI